MRKAAIRVRVLVVAVTVFLLSGFWLVGPGMRGSWAVSDETCSSNLKKAIKEAVPDASKVDWSEACSSYYEPKSVDGASSAEINGYRQGYFDGFMAGFLEGYDYGIGGDSDLWDEYDDDSYCSTRYSGDQVGECQDYYDRGFSTGFSDDGYDVGSELGERVCPTQDCKDDGNAPEDYCDEDDAECFCDAWYPDSDSKYEKCVDEWDSGNGPGADQGSGGVSGGAGSATNPGPNGVGGILPGVAEKVPGAVGDAIQEVLGGGGGSGGGGGRPGGSGSGSGGGSGGGNSGSGNGSSGGSAGSLGEVLAETTECDPSDRNCVCQSHFAGDQDSLRFCLDNWDANVDQDGNVGNGGSGNSGGTGNGSGGQVSGALPPNSGNMGAGNTTSILPDDWTIKDLLLLIVRILLYGIGVAAVIGVVIAGLMYLTAGDNEQRVVKSKLLLKEIVIGLILWAALFSLLNWLIPGFNPGDFGL